MSSDSHLCYLMNIIGPKIAVNGTPYYKVSARCNTGYNYKYVNFVCFHDISNLDLTSKIKLEVDGNKIKSIEAANFDECPECKLPVASLYEALSCRHGYNSRKEYIKGIAELVSMESKQYKHGNGLKMCLSIDNEKKYCVVFENSPLFNKFKQFNIEDKFEVEAWIENGCLIKIFNLC